MAENILDKFILQFIVENKDAKNKLKEMVSEADKVHQKLKNSTNKTDEKFKQFNKTLFNFNKNIKNAGVVSFANNLKGLGVAIGGVLAVKGITDLVMGLKDTAVRLNNLSNITGVSTTNLQIFGNMAKKLGIPVDSINNLFATMEQQLISLNTGANPQFAGALNRIGINARNSNGSLRNTVDIINDIRKSMRGKSEEQQRTILSTLGITPELLPLLKLSNEEYAKLQEKAKVGIMGDKDKNNFMKLNEQLQDMTQQFDKLKLSIGTAFLPLAETLTKVIIPSLNFINSLGAKTGVIFDAFKNSKVEKTTGGSPTINAIKDLYSATKLKLQTMGLHGDSELIAQAQMMQESGGNPNITGDNGKAFGLYQLHKDAAKDALGYTPNDKEMFDPALNRKMRDIRMQKGLELSGGNIAGALAYYHGHMTEFNQWKSTGVSNYASSVLSRIGNLPTQQYQYAMDKMQYGNTQNTSNTTNKTNNQSISIGNVSLPMIKSPQDFIDVFSGKNNLNNPMSFMNSFGY